MTKPVALIILDGFGYRKEKNHNAIAHAHTPNLDVWCKTYPHAILQASGNAVGLHEGSIGNSEVGHLTIGAGRVIQQPMTKISQEIDSKRFFENPILHNKLNELKKHNGTLHIFGLLSDASVHSHLEHLYAFIKAAINHGIHDIVVHPFLDGRDTPPQSAEKYLSELEQFLKQIGYGVIGSVHGRFYAMDRDKNWERTEQSYNVLTQPTTGKTKTWQEILETSYKNGITDEFIEPIPLQENAIIKPGDGIIFFNFRPDRARQITRAFVDKSFNAFKKEPVDIRFFISPVSFAYDIQTDALYPFEPIENTLKDILVAAGKTIFVIAETEKYAHVTYFFSGGKEHRVEGETRILIRSIPTKNYVKHPEMSAKEITQAVLHSLKTKPADFYVINYANPDMVAHSGNFNATVKAIECIDKELKFLYDYIVTKMDGTMFITADHGNAEDMYDTQAQQPRTAHTTNPVPFIMVNKEVKGKKIELGLHQLADIAPFILQFMKIPVPDNMKE